MIVRLIFLSAITFVGVTFAGEINLTKKDEILIEMLNNMVLIHNFIDVDEKFKAAGFPCNFKDNIDCKKRYLEKLKELSVAFVKTKVGVHTYNLWRVYNKCGDMLENKPLHRLEITQYLGKIPEEKSLMRLARELVKANVAGSHNNDLKLLTLFREHKKSKLQRLLEGSFTLHIPMARAMKKAKIEKSSFMGCFVDELKMNYRRDDNFVEVMRYLKEYIVYEYRVAKSDSYWTKTYPLLRLGDVENLSRQFLASFFFLNVMSSFLQERISFQEVKNYAQAPELLFNYGESSPRPFNKVSPAWNEVIQLILGDRKGQVRTKSLTGKSPRLPVQKSPSKVIDKIASAMSATQAISVQDLIQTIIFQYKNFDADPNLVSPPALKSLLQRIIDIEDQAQFESMAYEFTGLQNLIRQHESFYKTDNIADSPFADELEKLEKIESWQEFIASFEKLSDISSSYESVELEHLLDQMAVTLVSNMHFLEESELRRLLKIFFMKKKHAFNMVLEFLKKIKIVSENQSELQKELDSYSSHVVFDLAASSSYEKPTTFSTKPIYYKWNSRNIKIDFPNKGIREVVRVLKKTTAFKDADLELQTMVARLAKLKILEANETLYRQGDKSDSFALITDGNLEISVSNGSKNEVVANLSKGQFVGDMSIFEKHAKRSANVTASEITSIYLIQKQRFDKLMSENPVLMKTLFLQLARNVYGQMQRLHDLNIVDESECESLIDLSKNGTGIKLGLNANVGSVNSGEILLKKNTPAHNVYFVESGSLISQTNTWKTDSYVDEIPVLAKMNHSSDIIGGPEGCKYIFFAIEKFYQLATNNTDFLRPIARQLAALIKKNNTLLSQTDASKLQVAIENNDLEKVKEILSSPARIDVNAPCPLEKAMPKGARPIHIAARYNYTAVLEYLLKHGARVNEQDQLGNTAAHFAARHNHLKILEILKRFMADLKMENNRRYTPYQLAEEKGFRSIIDYLQSI